MAQAAPLVWLVMGASLMAIVTHVAIPPATWLALTLLLHVSRSMPAAQGLVYLCLAVYGGLAIGNRSLIPMSGPAYFAIVGLFATTFALPFAFDRFVAARIGSIGSTLIFPMALVATEFLRSRLSPSATWGSVAYTQYGFLPLMQVAALVGIWGRVPLVRPASSGISSAFDPWGRVLGAADYFAPGDRTLTVQVPVGRVPTLYARTGDLFAWLCVAGLAVALGIAAVSSRGISGTQRIIVAVHRLNRSHQVARYGARDGSWKTHRRVSTSTAIPPPDPPFPVHREACRCT